MVSVSHKTHKKLVELSSALVGAPLYFIRQRNMVSVSHKTHKLLVELSSALVRAPSLLEKTVKYGVSVTQDTQVAG